MRNGVTKFSDLHVREDGGVPATGTDHEPFGLVDRVEHLACDLRFGRNNAQVLDVAGGGGDIRLAADRAKFFARERYERLDIEGLESHRKNTTGSTKKLPDVVECGDGIVE